MFTVPQNLVIYYMVGAFVLIAVGVVVMLKIADWMERKDKEDDEKTRYNNP